MQQGVHRPGLFKAPNKKHKSGQHRSKAEIVRGARGRLDSRSLTIGKPKRLSKDERRNMRKNIRLHKQVKSQARAATTGGAANRPPFLTTIVSFDQSTTAGEIVAKLMGASPEEFHVSSSANGSVSCLSAPPLKSRFGFIAADASDTQYVLNSLKAADLLLLVWPCDGGIGEEDELLLHTVLAYGTPTTMRSPSQLGHHEVYGIKDLAFSITSGLPANGKQRNRLRKTLLETLEKWSMNENKLFNLDTTNDALNLLRHISTVRKSPTIMQSRRPHLLIDSVERYDVESDGCSTMKVSGYARGPPFDVNKLVHLYRRGDFQVKKIDREADPCRHNKSDSSECGSTRTLAVADPEKQTTLDTEVVPDPFDADQPEIDEDVVKGVLKGPAKIAKRVPKGTSDYQAAWIEEEECGVTEEEVESDDGMTDGDEEPNAEEESQCDVDGVDVAMSVGDTLDDGEEEGSAAVTFDEEEAERHKEERENRQWPDEVETSCHVTARERFQKYRGLKSFRTSPWDPKENLPRDYARIFKFSNYKHTKKVVVGGIEKQITRGENAEICGYISLHIAKVPQQLYDEWSSRANCGPHVVYGLLPHEHKMSVMNIVLRRHPAYSAPVKNKERLVFEVGYRRFEAEPLFSQHTNGEKFKMDRFMPREGPFCATVFAPIQFPPSSVLVFKRDPNGCERLVATGNVLDLNPDRIVLKRAIVSGHPFKVNKRTAIVKYMFFNKEDVEWFKPVELFTPRGRRGHIKETLGTRGLIKCRFDKPLTVQDPVMLALYKRVFPKWTYCGSLPHQDAVQSIAASAEELEEKMEE